MTWVLIAATVVVAAGLILTTPAGLIRLLVWPLAAAAAVTGLQVVHRFCVAFGAAGVENFGSLGGEIAVDPGQRAADRRRAAQIVLEGSLIGLAVALVVAVIPV